MILLLILAIVGTHPCKQCCSVDRIEINTARCYDPPMDQVIFWDWNERYGRYDCRGWIRAEEAVVVRNVALCKGWRVTAGQVIITETDDDPERCHLKLLESQYRNVMPWDVR